MKLSIPLSGPDITEREKEAVLEVLNGRYLSLGPKLQEFEKKFADFIGTKHAVAVNSGTSGLHLCLRALGIKEGDEVISTPFSFIASSNCLLYERSVPVFVDIEPGTFNLDVSQIESKITEKTKAILPVHVFGQPCDIEGVMKVARRHGLAVIEDACEAIGATFRGKKVGTFGDCAVFSFYPNKQMTTAEGGVIVTDNDQIADLARSLRNQGRGTDGRWLQHERLGYNYRMSDIHCALGIVQLERLGEILDQRASVAATYGRALAGCPGVRVPFVADHVEMSWFVYVILLEEEYSREQRDQIIERLRAEGIGCGNYFPAIHLQPFYVSSFGFKLGDFPVTESISGRTIALPFFNHLSKKDIEDVCLTLQRVMASF